MSDDICEDVSDDLAREALLLVDSGPTWRASIDALAAASGVSGLTGARLLSAALRLHDREDREQLERAERFDDLDPEFDP